MTQGDCFISVVDDDPSYRAALVNLVRSFGYTAEGFSGAQELLHSDQLENCACVIADIHMPGMDGIELVELLATLGKRLPAILITSWPSPGTHARGLNSGALGILVKPFDSADLLELIRVALG